MNAVYPLEPLLELRHYREERAERAAALAAGTLAQSKKMLMRKEEERNLWRRFHEEKVESLYAELIGESLKIDELRDFQADIARMNARDVEMDRAVEEAAREVNVCEERVQKTRLSLKIARREALKIEKHRTLWKEALRKENERLEDLEFEDFKPLASFEREETEASAEGRSS